MLMTLPTTLTDDDLIARIAAFNGVEQTATAFLIAHLSELEARNLHLVHGFRSLFGYCRHVLHCSEHEAYNRMEAVHAARRFPVILSMLAEGLLHLTAVRLLAPHLRDEDHLSLLGGAIHKSRREIVKLLACWFPSDDVASSVRKLPAPRHVAPAEPVRAAKPEPRSPAASSAPQPPDRPAVVAPLSVDRYRLQVTIDGEAHDDLRVLQDLMRREIPTGDAAIIVARALKLLRREAEKKAFSATTHPRAARPSAPDTRDSPAHVERAVWQR